MTEERIEYEAQAGYSVDSIATKIAVIANRDGKTVFCEVNGTELAVAPGEAPSVAVVRWSDAYEAKAEAYRRSPKGIAAKVQEDARRADLQRRHDASMACLPDRFEGHRAALTWMIEYADNSEWIYIKNRDRQRVIAACEASGYVRDDCIDLIPGSYTHPDIMARYVMGQALDGMYFGAIHGMTAHFGKQALEFLTQKEAGDV